MSHSELLHFRERMPLKNYLPNLLSRNEDDELQGMKVASSSFNFFTIFDFYKNTTKMIDV